MAKKIMMDTGYDKEIADVIKHGKKLDKELAKDKKATPKPKKKVKRSK